jgi:chromosome segregation ATPase
LEYFWLLAAVWAGFGALLTGLVLRKLDISRMSYREARHLLSAMVCSLSSRIQQNEALTRELSEQLQILNANQARVTAEVQTTDKERLLEYMQDWMANVRRFVDRVDRLQKNQKSLKDELEEMRIHVDRLSRSREAAGARVASVGVVTEDTLGRLSPTERGVLEVLVNGRKAAPEIGRLIAKSREHTARLMKSLFEQGFVERETQCQPYEYRLNDKVRDALARSVEQQASGS